MLNPYTYATGDPVNHTDPTGQRPVEAWKWFDETVLSWEGMPYLDIALAVGGIALTAWSGGTAAPLGIALAKRAIATRIALTVGTLATLPSAADQIAMNASSDGKGFMNSTTRTAFDVAGLVGGITDVGIGIAYKARQLHRARSYLTEADLLTPVFSKKNYPRAQKAMHDSGITNEQFLKFRDPFSDATPPKLGQPRHQSISDPVQLRRTQEAEMIRNNAKHLLKSASGKLRDQLKSIDNMAKEIKFDAISSAVVEQFQAPNVARTKATSGRAVKSILDVHWVDNVAVVG
ncbi:hypothetical protein EES43_08435 [Streptomyces sp. ADI96-02]|nr:hypothetical protein EES43_08435 [Streptomyces sp. ADI96-02]